MSRFRNRMILEDGCARWQRQITGALAVFEKKREQNAGPAITLSGDAQRALPHLAAHRPLPFNPRAREAGWGVPSREASASRVRAGGGTTTI
jgi:hypothetical protein